jgi:hypothetical protein
MYSSNPFLSKNEDYMIGWLTFTRLFYVVALAIEFTAIGACVASAQMYSDAVLNTKLERIRDDLIATVKVEIPNFVDPPDKVKLQALKGICPCAAENSWISVPSATTLLSR